jgi:hypothetical protein
MGEQPTQARAPPLNDPKDKSRERAMSVPLIGQGLPLPSKFPYRGAWILEPLIFLYIPDQTQKAASKLARFTVILNENSDNWSLGFDVEQLASALNITTAELFEANENQELTLENVYANTPNGEGATAKIYTFRLGDKEAFLTVERHTQFGSA